MAAAQQPKQQRDVVEFPPNVPVTVALKFAQGRIVSGMNGERVMFSTTDGRVIFLDPEVAGKIETLGVNVRENFTITKRTDGKRDSPVTWEVARCVGEQPNGTLIVPKPPATAQTPEPERKPVASALVSEAQRLVDAYAQTLEYGLTQYSGRVKPDEIKSIFLSAYINCRTSGHAA